MKTEHNWPLIFNSTVTVIWGACWMISNSDGTTGLISCVCIFVLLYVLLLPAYIAFKYNKFNKWEVFILNALIGWTVIGWIVCFIWASSGSDNRPRPEPKAKTGWTRSNNNGFIKMNEFE